MLKGANLTVGTLLRTFWRPISLTWFLVLIETTLTALIPLLIGFAIDGLLAGNSTALLNLAMVLTALIGVSVLRRLYDTRIFGTIRVELCKALAERSNGGSISTLNARLGMGRELADFLEQQVPAVMTAVVQFTTALIVLYTFHPTLAYAALATAVAMLALYSVFHGRFFRLNAQFNQQTEKQVRILETRSHDGLVAHLRRLRAIEVRLSDTEACVYGAIFTILLGFVIFNLWFASAHVKITVGTIFSIISYSWEFVEAALVMPVTLQVWSRLSEIMKRINGGEVTMVSAEQHRKETRQPH